MGKTKAIHRVKEFIRDNKITNRRFQEKAGLSTGFVSRKLKMNGDMTESTILKIYKAFPELTPEYLLTGENNQAEPLKMTLSDKIIEWFKSL